MKGRDFVDRRSALKAIAATGISVTSLGGVSAGKKPEKQKPAESKNTPFDISPAKQAIERLLTDRTAVRDHNSSSNQYIGQIDFEAKSKEAGNDYFEISTRGDRPVIKGTSPSVLLTGFNWYLKYVVGANITWNGVRLELPNKLPAPAQAIRKEASVTNRFALNDTTEGYTEPYGNWDYWEHQIDLLALHGINKYSSTRIKRQSITILSKSSAILKRNSQLDSDPRTSTVVALADMCCFAGSISETLIQKRIALGRNRGPTSRIRDNTGFPGYYGTVPRDFDEKHSTAHVIPQGTWAGGFERPGWLDPTGNYFTQVAEAFYRHQSKLFGDTSMYKMDLLHEGGSAGDVKVSAASKAVQKALREAHPDATWAILGWRDNPLPETIEAVDKSKMLILDGISETYSNLNREADWNGTPYAFGTIWNFGGNTTMGANMAVWNEKFWQWHTKSNSALSGIAMMPEAIDNNPVAFEFFTELAWRDGPVDFNDWFDRWTNFRYGGRDKSAQKAWRTMAQTAYSMPDNGSRSMAQVGLYESRPAFKTISQRYDVDKFAKALPALLNVDQEYRQSSAYKYDLMDVTRQVLSNRSFSLLPRIEAAYKQKNAEIPRVCRPMVVVCRAARSGCSTNKQMMLGPWLEDVQSMASSDAEEAVLEYDARSLITVWGNQKVAAVIHDYANREWAGSLSDFYYSRWQKFFDEREAALNEGHQPKEINWYAFENNWAHQQKNYETEPTGDIHQIAQQVLTVIREDPLLTESNR